MRRKINKLKKTQNDIDSCFNVLIYYFYYKCYENKVEKRKSMLKTDIKDVKNKKAVSNFCRQNTPCRINSKIRTDY